MASPRPSVHLLLPLFLLLSSTSLTLSINSSLSAASGLGKSLGINCRGSLLCPGHLDAFPADYIGTFNDIANGSASHCPYDFFCGPMNDTEIYLPHDNILCLPTGESFLGGICVFAQGRNVPTTGVTGALIKRKLQELRSHGCRVCGSVPLGGDNDPHRQGILTVNYISGKACKGLCPTKHVTGLLQSAANTSSLLEDINLLLES